MDIDSISLLDHSSIDLGIKLGEGAFGTVRQGLWQPKNQVVAVKLEPLNTPKKYLFQEIVVVQALQPISKVPRLLAHGITEKYSYMVTELLGESLNEKFKQCNRVFSLPTVTALGGDMLTLLESVHNCHYLHRDIKPHNFLVGTGKHRSEVYIIDFGLARRVTYGVPAREYAGQRRVCGTLPFVSLNLHLGMQYAKRDDLESLGFILVYFLRGLLPWYNPKGEKQPEYRVRKIKQETQIWTLCRGLPPQFEQFFTYVRALRPDQDPDYGMLRTLFAIVARDSDLPMNIVYDWEVNREGKRLARRGSQLMSRTGVSYTQHLSGTVSQEDQEERKEAEAKEEGRHRKTGSCPFAGMKVEVRGTAQCDSVTSPLTCPTTGSSRCERRHSIKFVGMKDLSSVTVASKDKFRPRC